MTHLNFAAINDSDLELVSGGGNSIVRTDMTGSASNLSLDSRMPGGGSDSGSVGSIGLADDPNGPQSQLG